MGMISSSMDGNCRLNGIVAPEGINGAHWIARCGMWSDQRLLLATTYLMVVSSPAESLATTIRPPIADCRDRWVDFREWIRSPRLGAGLSEDLAGVIKAAEEEARSQTVDFGREDSWSLGSAGGTECAA
jgi:hypothetical protein